MEFRTYIWKYILAICDDALYASSGSCAVFTALASTITQFNSCSLSPSGFHGQIWRLSTNRATHTVGKYRMMPLIPKTAGPVWSLESTSLSQISRQRLRRDLTYVSCSMAPIKPPHLRSAMILSSMYVPTCGSAHNNSNPRTVE